MNDTYKETGGLRWGETFWRALGASWPFATIYVSRESICIELSVLWVWRHRFKFARTDLQALRRESRPMGVGLRVVHNRTDCPPFILFWTFRYPKLKARLHELGYEVLD